MKKIVIDLATQLLRAYENERLIYTFDCITGTDDHRTDPGTFRVLDRRHPYVSHQYNVPMDYALFFTRDGKAMHQYHGPAPFSVARRAHLWFSSWFGSHGCVRLTKEDASTLYQWTPVGTQVVVR